MDFEIGVGICRLRTLNLWGIVSLNNDFLPKALMILFALKSVLSDFTLAIPAFLKSEFASCPSSALHSGPSVASHPALHRNGLLPASALNLTRAARLTV